MNDISFNGVIKYANVASLNNAALKNPLLSKATKFLNKKQAKKFARTPAKDILEITHRKSKNNSDVVEIKYMPGPTSQKYGIEQRNFEWDTDTKTSNQGINFDIFKSAIDNINGYISRKFKEFIKENSLY